MKKLLILSLVLLLAGSIAFNYLEFQRYSSSRPIIRMGSDRVTRKEYQDRLDHDYGKQVLNKLVYQKIIASAAAKAGVAPTDKDIDERLAEIDRRNPQLTTGARDDPEMMDDLRTDLAEDIGLENLRMRKTSISDSDVDAFYQKSRTFFSVPPQVKTTIVIALNDVDAETAKGLLEQSMSPTQIAHQPRLGVVGVAGVSLKGMSKPLLARVMSAAGKLKDHEITTIPVGTDFLIVRADSHEPGGVPPLSAIRPLVTRICRLQKAIPPDRELAELFRAAHVQYEVTKYQPFFHEIEDATKKLPGTETNQP